MAPESGTDAVAGRQPKGGVMRSVILGTIVTVGLSAFGVSVASAAPIARDGMAGQGD